MTTGGFPFVMLIEGDDPVIDGPEKVLCLSAHITSQNTICAIVQDTAGQVFRFPSSHESFATMRRVNMSVDAFLASCKLED